MFEWLKRFLKTPESKTEEKPPMKPAPRALKPETVPEKPAPVQPAPPAPEPQKTVAAPQENKAENRKRVEGVLRGLLKVTSEHGFKPLGFVFRVAGENQEGILYLEESGREPGQYRLRLGVHEIGDDHEVSHYMFKGTREEIEAYVQEPEHTDEWMVSLTELSERVRQGFD